MSNVRKVLADALGLPASSTDDELAHALAQVLTPKLPTASSTVESTSVPVDDPQGDFDKLARLVSKTHGISLSDAYAYVSAEVPTLYQRATNRARLN